GLIPNNAELPLIVYRNVLDVSGRDPESAILARFHANGWGNSWVDGIFPFHHYHSTAHEVLGMARGRAKVRFRGPGGILLPVRAGDAVLIPAGVGHCRVDAADLSVVGAYPQGQDWDLLRANMLDRARALQNLAHVPLPESDPLFANRGPVHHYWNKTGDIS
ncbi:MAG: hypothetical protein D6773_02220, partial [Alphaproteobacteria bacterium]